MQRVPIRPDVIPMPRMTLPAHQDSTRKATPGQRMQIVVNVHAEVLDPELARRQANVWLLENAGNLLGAENPELVLGDRLLWRYDVIVGTPSLDQPGYGEAHRVGQITLDAVTGEVQDPATLIRRLHDPVTPAAR